MDRERGRIERISIDGQGREVIVGNFGTCVQAMTLDFESFTIFWTDRCTLQLESIRMDGSRLASSVSIQLNSLTTAGISIFNDYLYWSDSSSRTLRRVNRTSGELVMEVSQQFLTFFGGVDVVHPSKQPQGECLDEWWNQRCEKSISQGGKYLPVISFVPGMSPPEPGGKYYGVEEQLSSPNESLSVPECGLGVVQVQLSELKLAACHGGVVGLLRLQILMPALFVMIFTP